MRSSRSRRRRKAGLRVSVESRRDYPSAGFWMEGGRAGQRKNNRRRGRRTEKTQKSHKGEIQALLPEQV